MHESLYTPITLYPSNTQYPFNACLLPLQDHVRSLAALTANVKRHGAPFRHMLFYGEGPLRCAGCTGCACMRTVLLRVGLARRSGCGLPGVANHVAATRHTQNNNTHIHTHTHF